MPCLPISVGINRVRITRMQHSMQNEGVASMIRLCLLNVSCIYLVFFLEYFGKGLSFFKGLPIRDFRGSVFSVQI